MILHDFEYERPDTLEQACLLLRRLGPAARVMAGGTDLLPNMRVEIIQPVTVISLGAIVPAPPKREPDRSLRLDALSRLADLQDSALVREAAPMLSEAAHTVAGNQIRNMGTLGGNLCQETRCLYLNQKHDYQFAGPCFKRGGNCCYPYPGNASDTCWSVFMSDTAPALIALGAELEILGEQGTRRIPVEQLYTGSGLKPLSLGESELIRAVIVPPQPRQFGWGYHKSARRGGLEFGMAVIAATLQLGSDHKTCTGTRIAMGAIRERPVRAFATERSLAGCVLDEQAISQAAESAAQEANPLPHHGFTRNYLRDNIRVHLRRVLTTAAKRARGEFSTAGAPGRTVSAGNGGQRGGL
jgi:4-hydroxybenzoyl-CoA reductase subunit beta